MTNSKAGLSRRKFLLGSAATAASAAVTVSSERADAFFNTFGFMKKPAGNGQTSNGYAIGQSLRFTPANSTFLSRTVTAGGNQQTWTLSLWIKRTALTVANDFIFGVSLAGADNFGIRFGSSGNANDNLDIYSQFDNEFGAKSVPLFRDCAAWGHLVLAMDVTQGTNANKIKIYWNGAQVSSLTADESFAGPYPTGTTAMKPNAASTVMYLGKRGSGAAVYTSCYISEFHWIDGQALAPSSFGQVDSNSGQWIPRSYSGGNYGVNGCYLNFSNSANLGQDFSGQGNNWTPSGFAPHDQVLDSPTNNFGTWNPLSSLTCTLSSGNLSLTTPASFTGIGHGSLGMVTGKWYWEVTPTTGTSTFCPYIGILDASVMIGPTGGGANDPLAGYCYSYLGDVRGGNTGHATNAIIQGSLATYASGDIIGFALDCDGNSIKFYKNGTLVTTVTIVSGFTWIPYIEDGGSVATVVALMNSGQGGQTGLTYDAASGGRFKYTPPSGFKALCSANLPTPAIKKPSQYFNTVLYQGNGATNHAITGVGNQPDLVWIKNRTNPQHHRLFDSVRGATKALYSSLMDAEQSFADTLSAFGTDGFTVGFGDSGSGINQNGDSHVAWCWKAGGAAVTNNAGTIISQVSAIPTAGFSIVSYTGNAAAGATVGHGLNAVPNFILAKNRDAAADFLVYHSAFAASQFLFLDTTQGLNSSASPWNNVMPTSTLLTLGSGGYTNGSSERQIAYLWTEVAGFSKFGSYTGNGSADGPFVYCGFKPRFILGKRTDNTSNWWIFDTARDSFNGSSNEIYPNLASSEANATNPPQMDIVSNGFKIRRQDNMTNNSSGATYIFAAFAESPMKYATAR